MCTPHSLCCNQFGFSLHLRNSSLREIVLFYQSHTKIKCCCLWVGIVSTNDRCLTRWHELQFVSVRKSISFSPPFPITRVYFFYFLFCLVLFTFTPKTTRPPFCCKQNFLTLQTNLHAANDMYFSLLSPHSQTLNYIHLRFWIGLNRNVDIQSSALFSPNVLVRTQFTFDISSCMLLIIEWHILLIYLCSTIWFYCFQS